MADHLVDARAHRLGEGIVIQRARVRAALDRRLVDYPVELVGRHSRPHGPGRLVQDLPAYPARRPRPRDLLLAPDGHRVLLPGLLLGEGDRRASVVREGDALWDVPSGADLLRAELASPGEGRWRQEGASRSLVGGVGPLGERVGLVRGLVLGPRGLEFLES